MQDRIQPPFLPPELASTSWKCSSCGSTVQPNWWQRHNDPFIPIQSDVAEGTWRQASVITRCKCGEPHNLPVPTKDLKHRIEYFGDEAYREPKGLLIEVYSLIGGTSGPVRDAAANLFEAKKQLIPHAEPSAWRVHATELVHTRTRLAKPLTSGIDLPRLNEFWNHCAAIISELGKWKGNRAATTIYQLHRHPKRQQRTIRDKLQRGLFLGLLTRAIHASTSAELLPVFTFDAQTAKGVEREVEGWADEAYLGSRRYLGYLFLTHSNDIPKPRFVAPGSNPMLELADIHAYFTARSLERRALKLSVDRPLSQFGEFDYLGMKGTTLEWKRGSDIPISWWNV